MLTYLEYCIIAHKKPILVFQSVTMELAKNQNSKPEIPQTRADYAIPVTPSHGTMQHVQNRLQ